jgi:hypothetical protein
MEQSKGGKGGAKRRKSESEDAAAAPSAAENDGAAAANIDLAKAAPHSGGGGKRSKRSATSASAPNATDGVATAAVVVTGSGGGGGSSSSSSSSSSASAGAGGGSDDIDDTDDDSDEDVALVGSKGTNSLIDFPHSREHCVTHPFATSDHAAHCLNCFCMVCDMPADKCEEWEKCADPHCHAVFALQKWKTLRTQRQQAIVAAAAPSASRAAPAVNPAQHAAVQRTLARYHEKYTADQRSRVGGNGKSCEAILTMTEQVWPEETAAPAGLRVQVSFAVKKSLQVLVWVEGRFACCK